ncbi:replicative DNA helicase [Phaeocystidibacter marisrubri]|uniref:Replicative DNA helicase n=1 Tax=Phaeocystidibacter marisrubri TaxID=1577780 RepID=A0A6L3ZGK4_9FLAO|nr:replicative DNA helicase [Phaeocystidibacter marisrubri]KAB2816984.1 replicative DNA helicase [Phaeocystidibacter marisrubri]GGH77331.1 replicative DNA helicase [Phaeocystidibacter marisrubri]
MNQPDNNPSPRRNQKSKSVVQLEQGRIPPQAVELEEAVLGALLIDNSALNQVIDILSPEAFYKDTHSKIYQAIHNLFGRSEAIDILTVAQDLRKKGQLDQVGGEYYLVHLSQRVSSSAHIEYHARIIVQKHIQRELIRVSSEIINEAFDESADVLELLDKAEQSLFNVAQGNLKKNYESSQDLIHQAISRIEEISKKEGLSGVPSGFSQVDRVTSGWQRSDLVIIAARPGMGKTAFVLSMARNIAIDHQTPVAVFSLEMSSVQLITRLISSETGLSSEKLRKGNLDDHEWQQLLAKVKNLEDAPIFIDDTPALSVFDMRAKCRRLVAQHGVSIIIIDYLQLMTAGGGKNGGNREQEISTISRSLKSIAKELNVPVIALSQLSRSVETRGGSKRPLLSDLRESGAIEQDADIVSFIYRPEYYGITEWDDDGSPSESQGEFMIAKHRNGSLENVRLKFEGHMAKFSDLDEVGGFDQPAVFESKMNSDDENQDFFGDSGPTEDYGSAF